MSNALLPRPSYDPPAGIVRQRVSGFRGETRVTWPIGWCLEGWLVWFGPGQLAQEGGRVKDLQAGKPLPE